MFQTPPIRSDGRAAAAGRHAYHFNAHCLDWIALKNPLEGVCDRLFSCFFPRFFCYLSCRFKSSFLPLCPLDPEYGKRALLHSLRLQVSKNGDAEMGGGVQSSTTCRLFIVENQVI
uniref:Uncharacterized protein n=1 Tax=Caenorhabditis japonica TaxID=281687 RepID=A0A8R1IMX9_CAEJA